MVASVRSGSSALLISLRNDTDFPLFFAHPRVRRIISRRSVPRGIPHKTMEPLVLLAGY